MADPIEVRIENKLRENLKVEHFVSWRALSEAYYQEIVDTSNNCGSAFALVIVSPDFAKKMTLARHRLGE